LCFNRFHNYARGQLANINENGKFSMLDKKTIEPMLCTRMVNSTEEQIQAAVDKASDAALAKRDNDLFQVCRLYLSLPVAQRADWQGHVWTLLNTRLS
jgi:hypothetical protein